MSSTLTVGQIYNLARAAGLSRAEAVMATAIALAESGGRVDAVGDENLTDATWGPSLGLWQVRSVKADRGSGRARDAERLRDPAFNARAMVEISNGGRSWAPWSAYTNGSASKQLTRVYRALGIDAGAQAPTRAPGGLPGQWRLPIARDKFDVSSVWGDPRPGGREHAGIDLAAPSGTKVRSTTDGVVVFAGESGGYGQIIKVRHGGGYETWYAHLSRMTARLGDRLRAGQELGRVGSTGTSTGPHLHFEVRRRGDAVNPRPYLFGEKGALVAGAGAGGFAVQQANRVTEALGKPVERAAERLVEGGKKLTITGIALAAGGALVVLGVYRGVQPAVQKVAQVAGDAAQDAQAITGGVAGAAGKVAGKVRGGAA